MLTADEVRSLTCIPEYKNEFEVVENSIIENHQKGLRHYILSYMSMKKSIAFQKYFQSNGFEVVVNNIFLIICRLTIIITVGLKLAGKKGKLRCII